MADLQALSPRIAPLAKKYGLTLVMLFGSSATGRTHAHSDVDIAFEACGRKTPAEIARMQIDFTHAMQRGEVELVDIASAPPLLLRAIAHDALLLFEEQAGDFARFKIYAFKRHMEARPLLSLRTESLHRFLQRV
jgi:predicted nucleotidyltransferase